MRKLRSIVVALLALILALGGAALIVVYFGAQIKENRAQKNLRSLYAAQVSDPSFELELETDFTAHIELPGDDEQSDTGEIVPLIPVFILKIPKIDLDVVVVEGTDYSSLLYAVGHFSGTAFPGQIGNLALAGHRSFVSGEFFLRLDEIQPGDELIIEFNGKTFIYLAAESFIVNPDDVWVLEPTEDATITLVTCTPVNSGTHRLIVKGVLSEPDSSKFPAQR